MIKSEELARPMRPPPFEQLETHYNAMLVI